MTTRILLLDKKQPNKWEPVRQKHGLSLFTLIRSSARVYAFAPEAQEFRKQFPWKQIRSIKQETYSEHRSDFVYFQGNTTRGFREIIAI